MTSPEPVNMLWPRLLELVDCLCTMVGNSGLDPLCTCQVMPGRDVAYDYVGVGCGENADGMGWVRLGPVYATTNFPQQLQTISRCQEAEFAFTFDMGIIRTFPVPDDGEPPDPAILQALTERQVSESLLMMRSIVCCYDGDVVLGTYNPIGPQGGAVGGMWTATAMIAP